MRAGCGGKERGMDTDLGQTELGCVDYISPLFFLLSACLSPFVAVSLLLSKLCQCVVVP